MHRINDDEDVPQVEQQQKTTAIYQIYQRLLIKCLCIYIFFKFLCTRRSMKSTQIHARCTHTHKWTWTYVHEHTYISLSCISRSETDSLQPTWMWKSSTWAWPILKNFLLARMSNRDNAKACIHSLSFSSSSHTHAPTLTIISQHTQYINTRCGSGNSSSSSSKESSILRIAHVTPLCYTETNNKCSECLKLKKTLYTTLSIIIAYKHAQHIEYIEPESDLHTNSLSTWPYLDARNEM